MAPVGEELIYLYGIVPVDAPPPPEDLAGIDGGPVALRPVGGVAAIVGAVAADVYGDEPLNERLGDLAWVGDRGMAHERVLDWFAERVPVIPLSLFSLHRDLERVKGRVLGEEEAFRRILDRLRGRREWGVKLWRRDARAVEGIDRISPSLEKLAAEIEAAPPGRRFLLERRRDAMRKEELRAASKRISHETFAALRAMADDAVAVPLPPAPAHAERVLLLHAAYLVRDDDFEAFRTGVGRRAQELAESGFEIELTGPWPPYHFTTADDE